MIEVGVGNRDWWRIPVQHYNFRSGDGGCSGSSIGGGSDNGNGAGGNSGGKVWRVLMIMVWE